MNATPEVKGFHAHVYYDPENPQSREAAAKIREALATQFEVQLGRWHDRPIGPHSQAMYQVVFSLDQFAQVVPWLMLHRQGLDILIHPETGNDLADHTNHALWLGEKLALRLEVLQP
ncbi:DOPA 4,5-dioxygenase family protein [Leptolyngbya sp. NK1-12]|uniref:DOPA 4,5-dioxygenase family protein n=2 Tax=Leptolyngbya sp. NK1-12 TaxID=2547451 RepID=A0AA96WMF7_9CYAN|nr:DOPA 4,5-dioxygenase family protein [Elainella sp. C42_A2020_010]RNJ65744.1 MAG: 4,5-dioxygenase [Leptolyngbya sp. IPPAS B-1204]WNZ27964.1 DOPA 4,5-dioxygenase family protein [Leptolyngbya sp. NK1-12]